MTFKEYQKSLNPHFLEKAYGVFNEVLGQMKDDGIADARERLTKSLIQYAHPEILYLIAKERDIPIYPFENPESVRLRLLNAWELHGRAGTMPGMSLELAYAGYETRIDELYKTNRELWSQFDVYFRSNIPTFTGARWNAGHKWDTDVKWNTGFVDSEFQRIIDIIKNQKPAHTMPRTLYFFPEWQFWNTRIKWNSGQTWPAPAIQINWRTFYP